MKITCTQENLIKGLNIVAHIAGKNISLPILNNILIKVEDGVIKLMSTNLDIGIKTTIRGKIEKGGETTVGAKILTDYVALLAGGNVTMEIVDNNLLIKTENQETSIRCQGAEEYPVIPWIEATSGVSLEAKILKEVLGQVINSASYEDIRPELSGVLMAAEKDTLVMAATDSYRLAEKKIKITKNNLNQEKAYKIIPLRVLQEVLRVCGEGEERVEINFSDSQVVFNFQETTIMSRLIEGNYPDYKEIIPKEWKTRVVVDKTGLISQVKVASLFSRAGINDVFLEFNKDNKIIISAANVQYGENKSKIEATVEGENNSAVFNYKYLLDGLQNINHKKIVIEVNSADMPVILRPEGGDDYLYLIMPIRR
ncbi:MAG TPA: DNA polymerase III subunit beta [Patescibacteria group bacterium]|nr:DNA polymerase III subunit beta [Patescibacteria group bacterium]